VAKYSKVFYSLLVAIPAIVLVLSWKGIGSFLFAWVFHLMLMMITLAFTESVAPGYNSNYYSIANWEMDGKKYEWLGVNIFRRVLVWIGWEKINKTANPVRKNAVALKNLDYRSRQSESGHLFILLTVLAVGALVALFNGLSSSFWLLGLNIPLHFYPIILQRYNRPRYQKVLAKLEHSAPSTSPPNGIRG
jgi:hypothetical protein